jgi:hypothetical protein
MSVQNAPALIAKEILAPWAKPKRNAAVSGAIYRAY